MSELSAIPAAKGKTLNAELRTPNVECTDSKTGRESDAEERRDGRLRSTPVAPHLEVSAPGAGPQKFDLEKRLLEFSTRIIRLATKLDRSPAARHVGSQILRAGTSPYANHGEAEAAESADDFLHKLRICLKELRETLRWLLLIRHVPLVKNPTLLEPLIDEAGQLIRIFRRSVETVTRRSIRSPSSAKGVQ